MGRRNDPHSDVLVTPDTRRVVRYKTDSVGNDLSARLRWCSTHQEPVWVYGDDSYACPYDVMVEVYSDDHDLIDGPWEVSP